MQAMSKTREGTQWTTEAAGWATVEGKHAEMSLLRQAAMIGARTVMEQVGFQELRGDQDIEEISASVGLSSMHRAYVSEPIVMDGSEDSDQSARICEFGRVHQALFVPPRRSRRPFTRKKTDTQSATQEWYKPRFHIIESSSGQPDDITEMLAHSRLDIRSNIMQTRRSMIDHYQAQIDQLVLFMGKVDHLAELTGTYIYSRHLSEYLEDRDDDA